MLSPPDLPPPGAHALATAELCSALGVDPECGLATAEAEARLARFGANVLTQTRPVPRWRKFVAQFESPLVLLLLAAVAVSFGVWAMEHGDTPPYEALTILAIVALNAVLGYVQESRAEKAVAGLQRMSAATALVLRDGERSTVAAAAVVPGDVLLVEEGMTIAADARVLDSVSLKTGEAALTGESVPVAKHAEPVSADAAVADRLDMIYAGTAAVYGHGRAVVVATGMRTEIRPHRRPAAGDAAGGHAAAARTRSPGQDPRGDRHRHRHRRRRNDPADAARHHDGGAGRRPAVHGVARSLRRARGPGGGDDRRALAGHAADGAPQCDRAPALGGRNPGIGDGDRQRQDRDADPERDDRPRAGDGIGPRRGDRHRLRTGG